MEKAKVDPASAAKLFSVPDFVGDMCKSLASRIRGAVAAVNFDDFHKGSARIIRGSVLGYDRTSNKIRDKLEFPSNLLCVTSVDVQSVEPVDQKTKDSLMKSVQLAIEITTNAQEALAKHEAQRIEQDAKGKLENLRLVNEATAELQRQKLLVLQTQR
jgi:major vault protein